MNPVLGQYFTTDITLKEKICEFILNKPDIILEPSIGQGDLVAYIGNKLNVKFDSYEIDSNIKLLDGVENVTYGDFLKQNITKKYKTIVGNPPYIRTKTGNLYIEFIEKCFQLLDNEGELIFIVPSDFLKLTSAANIINEMLIYGTFTHIYHPNNEKLFQNANIDIIVFRYSKQKTDITIYNNEQMYLVNNNSMITFEKEKTQNNKVFSDYFDIYVGLVSGKEDIYKNKMGNIEVLNGENKIDKYIFVREFPSKNNEIDKYLLEHKDTLITRKIRKFNENNWFEWGAPRNISSIEENLGKDCIYIYNLTRKQNVAFVGKVQYFGGSLLMLIPKKEYNLIKIVDYLNSVAFKNNFMFSGRFKIGHRQISNSNFPNI